jgi:pimeloyl-ACP methyl ester carboxylesterase
MQEQFVQTQDGVQLRVDAGGSGPPVIWLHGLTDSGRDWREVLRHLNDVHSIAVDLRGHGGSSRQGPYDVETMAGDVHAVVNALDLDRPPVVVGHSLGGAVAVGYAGLYPATGVVNVDQRMQLDLFAEHVKPREHELYGPNFHGALKELSHQMGTEALTEAQRAELDAHRDATTPDVVLGIWGPLFETDPASLRELSDSLMSQVQVPYVELYGNEPGEGYRKWLHKLVPHAGIELWEGCGHYVHWVQPERFAARVRSLVERWTGQ